MKVIYNLGILIFILLVKLVALFNSKARLWVNGRKNWEALLKNKINPEDKNVWIHCASLGEFEQGRPVMERLKGEKPDYKIILTFFSPSGYEVSKNYDFVDYVCYLPADTPGNAAKFISLVNPAFVILVKYEFWTNYMLKLSENNVPLYLISGIFRPDQHFFKWYGTFFRKVLSAFSYLFVQDQESKDLLAGIGIDNIMVAGDTRFDRVVQIAEKSEDIPQIKAFKREETLFLAGSSWPRDEKIIAGYINRFPQKMKWVFAPHEIDLHNIERLEKLFTAGVVRFSKFSENAAGARVMIIDNIGMLSSAYRYATIAEVGGGFGSGIHNILEAACWGIPVIFGPNYQEYREATDLIELGGAKSFSTFGEFSKILDNLLSDRNLYSESAKTAASYVKQNTGATAKIMAYIISQNMNNAL
jgi:3-deoxy-D-manno-octulosonic-acid transferase